MAFSINQATLVGNVTKQIELKYTQSGQAFARFGLATNRSQKKQDGSYEDVPTFHNIVVWGKMAEFITKSCPKGAKLVIQGRIDNRQYKDQNGVTHYVSEVIAENVIPMYQQNNNANAPANAPANPPAPAPTQPVMTPSQAAAPSGVGDMNMGEVAGIFNGDPEPPMDNGNAPEKFPWET